MTKQAQMEWPLQMCGCESVTQVRDALLFRRLFFPFFFDTLWRRLERCLGDLHDGVSRWRRWGEAGDDVGCDSTSRILCQIIGHAGVLCHFRRSVLSHQLLHLTAIDITLPCP
jgi:hypothetical protein